VVLVADEVERDVERPRERRAPLAVGPRDAGLPGGERDRAVDRAGVEQPVAEPAREQLDLLRQDLDQALEVARRELTERRASVARQHALVQVRGGALVKRET